MSQKGNDMGFSFVREDKEATRSTRLTISDLDPEWVAALEHEWKSQVESKTEYNHVTVMDDPKDVGRYAAYARAWGLSRDGEKIEVRKLPPRKGESNGTLRLDMHKYDPNAPKLGRKPKTTETVVAEAPAVVAEAAKTAKAAK